MILACKNITKSYGTDVILNQVSFHINEREKAAIVGINGAGKSTLLKIIMGELAADEGEVILAKDATIGYLAQHQELSSESTIYDEMLTVKADVIRLEENIRSLERQMKEVDGEELTRLLNTYTRLTHEFEHKNGYAYKSEVVGILKGLGFTQEEFTKPITTLSGGQKTRVALGKLLLSTQDLILLDEPTNHLDMESIAWLENFLVNYSGAVVVVAHDRYFLDKVVTKVVELEGSKAVMYEGNYTAFAQKKEAQRETVLRHYFNQQREIKRQEEVIAKLRSFNREKSIKRAESREKMLEKVERIEKPAQVNSRMDIRLEPHVISGNDVLTVRGLSKAFGSNLLFENINFEIKREEKVAIIGNNGTGKTTLLKIINGLEPADSGEIRLGTRVKIGYYDQEHQVLDPKKTIFEEIQDEYPHMNDTAIRNTLAAFLFTNDDVFKLIGSISGGERGRVSLAKLMLSEANLLILDEPTNHLDITSKEILENAIRSYTGTVLYVSHDRYFINRTATRILDLTAHSLVNYIGNYDYYLEKKADVERAQLGTASAPAGAALSQTADRNVRNLRINQSTGSAQGTIWSAAKPQTQSEGKLVWQQQKEEQARIRKHQNDLKKLENEIQSLEARNQEIDELLTREEVFTDPERLMELNKEKQETETRLEQLMEKWEEMAEMDS
ncbi:MAG TPA: ABC-F family ATP-binding cassette domain-containing protein [Candidatus Caccomorpha excrementavium]|nr:ABC-F family ATP-binding cassette domain-containing protein [Candidatus Caccomorpha excrementavium]